ncbi:7713_t:CDS:1, partial [Racocetra persica]
DNTNQNNSTSTTKTISNNKEKTSTRSLKGYITGSISTAVSRLHKPNKRSTAQVNILDIILLTKIPRLAATKISQIYTN